MAFLIKCTNCGTQKVFTTLKEQNDWLNSILISHDEDGLEIFCDHYKQEVNEK